MRSIAKRDGDHAEVRDRLRAVGLLAADTGSLGGGFPDLVVGSRRPPCPACHRRWLVMVEVKDGRLPPSRRCLTPDQQTFHALWGDHVCVALGADHILDILAVPRPA